MTTPATQTVHEALAANSRASTIFEVLGIDYCCGGERSLREAALLAHASPDELLSLFDDAPAPEPPAPDRLTSPLAEITRYIVEHFHRRARRRLVELLLLARRAAVSHCGVHAELGDVRDDVEQLARELTAHMLVEERYLFRYIDSMESPLTDAEVLVPLFGTLKYPLQSVRHDHSKDLTALADICAVTRGYDPPPGGCDHVKQLYEALQSFELELKEHIAMEDDTLFWRAVELERKSNANG